MQPISGNTLIGPARASERGSFTAILFLVTACVALNSGPARAQTEWRRISPAHDSHTLTSVALLGDKLVALGEAGLILTSWDGKRWETHESGMSSNPRILLSFGSRLLALGDAGAIYSSEDGFNWTRRETGTASDLKAIAWNGETAVAVGAAGTIIHSRDGSSWEKGVVKTDRALISVGWLGTRFMAVNDSHALFTSADGQTWTEIPNPTGQSFTSFYRKDGLLLAVGGDYSLYSTPYPATDSAAWTWHPLFDQIDLSACATSGNLSIAPMINSSGYMSSTDGINWTVTHTASPIHAAIWTGDRFVLVGDQSIILTSPDGLVFESQDQRGFAIQASLNSIAANDTLLVAVAVNGQVISSKDGESWTQPASISPFTLRKVMWTGTRFVALDDQNGLMESRDGETWTLLKPREMPPIYDLIWAENRFIAVNGSGVLYSPDGVTWTAKTTDLYQASLYAIGWDGNAYVALGTKLLTSFNGSDWDLHDSKLFYTDPGRASAACGKRICVATGNAGIFYSQDTTWRDVDASYDQYGRVAWLKDRFMLPSFHGIRISTNGAAWSLVRLPLLREVARLGDRFVAVGGSGEIWVADAESSNGIRPVAPGKKTFTLSTYGNTIEIRMPFKLDRSASAAIYAPDGRMVPSQVSRSAPGTLRLSVDGLKRGLYFARVWDSGKAYTASFLYAVTPAGEF